jgi:hypothetical protein
MNDASSSAAAADPPRPTVAEGGQEACDELVKQTEADPGAPFAPDILRDLAALKLADRAVFESLRTRLKKVGVRVTELDRLIAEENNDGPGGGPNQADLLVALAEAAEPFQTPAEEAFADLEIKGHRETWAIQSRGFRRWLRRRFFEEFRGAPSSEAVTTALNVIEARALHDTPVREVHVRVGVLGDEIYLDRCDADWSAIRISRAEWTVVSRPAIRFRRSPDMRALPEPERDGSVDGLRPLLNIPSGPDGDADFILAIAYLLGCLRGRGPYPVMAIGGEQGTAKSTRSAMLRTLIDPRKPALRALPRDERDLVIAARNQLVLAFDNVSGLRWWLSDALCRVASGSGFGTRQLYTDADEVLFEGARPVIANGIEDFIERPDLAERSIFFLCAPIDDRNRLSEEEIWSSFQAAHPPVLGALLDAVVEGLGRFSEIRPLNLPRMADFAHWVVACEPALWKDGAFLEAYNKNILGAVENVLEASAVAVAVRELMDGLAKEKPPQTTWKGTASDLLTKLAGLVSERTAKSDAWPSSGRALSGQLRRAASFLRRAGINVVFDRREAHTGKRQIVIMRTPPPQRGKAASSPSSPSSPAGPTPNEDRKTNVLDRVPGDDRVTIGDDGPEPYRHPGPAANPLGLNGSDLWDHASDGGDGGDNSVLVPPGVRMNKTGTGGFRLRALDLCCGAGGVARGLMQAGFHVTGVDIKFQRRYVGDAFIQMDAIAYLKTADLSQFDFIWASPPCQFYCALKHAPGKHRDDDLIPPTRDALIKIGKPYVIENVEEARDWLRNPVTLCGSHFGLGTHPYPDGWRLERHRLFEVGFWPTPLAAPGPCRHDDRRVVGIYGGNFRDRGGRGGKNHVSGSNVPRSLGFRAMGIPLGTMTVAEISDAIPPAYARFVAEQWLAQATVLAEAAS